MLAACTGAGVRPQAGTPSTSSASTSTTSQTTTTTALPPPPLSLWAAKGETSLPRGLVRDGRLVRGLLVDDGRLVIEPLPLDARLPITLQRAKAVVAAAQSGEGAGWEPAELIAAGVVTIAPGLTKGLPGYESRPAWVALATASDTVRLANSDSPQPWFEVIVLDARTGGDVLVYRSEGLSVCGGPSSACAPTLHQPSVSAARELVSIAWNAVSQRPDPYGEGFVDWVISYALPRCAAIFDGPGIYFTGSEYGPATLYIEVEIPMVPTRSCSPSRLASSVVGPERSPISAVRHAAVGVGVSL